MFRRWSAIATCGAALLGGGPAICSAQNSPSEHEQQVRSLVEAFNVHDGEAMLRSFTDDVQWLTVQGSAIGTESSSKDELRRSLQSYLRSCNRCRSRLEGVFATDQRVIAVEVATWMSREGPREQRTMAVYEFAGPLIRRAYFFPAEESTDRAAPAIR